MRTQTCAKRWGVMIAALLLALLAAPPANTPVDVDARADALVRAMTQEEKLGLVSGTVGSALERIPGEKRIGAGHINGVPRLGIPDLYETDASLGVANANEQRKGDVAVALPSALATAASFDPDIAYAGGAMIGEEARAKGFNVLLAGGANLTRDPWAGRDFEYLGEDPWLTGVMAGAHIAGVQSAGIVSTVKHFALNAQETGRTVMSADLGEAPLRESDLLAFQIAIERGRPGSVMCGYNRVNGDYDCENHALLTDILKRDWGYPGWVMSDWGAVHSTAKAIEAGLDQQSGRELDAALYFGKPLKQALLHGEVPQSRLDDMAHRIVREMIDKGLIDRPVPTAPTAIDYAGDAEVAQRAVEAGMVLLRNEHNLLPLAETAQRILVVGGHADIGVLSGGGSSQVRPVAGVALTRSLPHDNPFSGFIKRIYGASPPLAAIRTRAPTSQIAWVDGKDASKAAAAALDADVVILFAEQWRSEAMDLPDLALPDGQDALINAVAAANPKTVVVLETGGPVLMPWRDKVGAIVEAWYPGERGGPTIARLLFGDMNPSGRLPITFPAAESQAPRAAPPSLPAANEALHRLASTPPPPGVVNDMSGGLARFDVDYVEGADVGYRWYERQRETPLYPFGYGLSYTRFAYRGLRVTVGQQVIVRFTVTNIGNRAGADVPQLYAAIAAHGAPPIRRLVGFQRVQLAPGQSRAVTLTIDPRLLGEYDVAAQDWRVRGGVVRFELGRHAGDATLRAAVRIAPRMISAAK
jgi:beta-glucosidase